MLKLNSALANALLLGGSVYATYRLIRVLFDANWGLKCATSVTDLVGDTPMVRLHVLSNLTGCEIWAKLEYANPAGSAKDRVALAIVNEAEKAGKITRNSGDKVFEGTSGSTGISLAMVCCARGLEAHIVVPTDTSLEKQQLLKNYGAVLHIVPPASISDPKHYVNEARRLCDLENAKGEVKAVFADQFENVDNFQVHFRTTGPEIAKQMPNITTFVHGAGTGGTIAGVAKYLKCFVNSKINVVLADVPGSGALDAVKFGVMFNIAQREGQRRRHQVDTSVEGIGLTRITRNFKIALDEKLINDALLVTDEESRYMADFLLRHEGLFVGASSAVNAVAAFRTAVKNKQNRQIVTIFCDHGSRHINKFYKLPVNKNCQLAEELRAIQLTKANEHI